MMKICPECLERVGEDLEYCPEDGTRLREIQAREEDPMEGRVLDEKWVLESKIGGGGMGTVYRSHQLSVDRAVAIKLLRSELCEDDEHIERFFREANVASNVHDPRCVTIYDFGQSDDDQILYLAMEYLEGESLHERMKTHPLTFEQTLQVGIEVTRALETLHSEGVIHRDLKPENVFLVDEIGSEVSLKLLDFGLAKLSQSDATPVTEAGQIYGTPEFMSPEQCMGSEIGPKSDLYALGCLLYELVAGQPPFSSNSSVEVLLAHVNRPAPALTGRPAVPVEYGELIMELLEKNPEKRPGDVVEVRERLAEILGQLGRDETRSEPAARLFDVEVVEEDELAVSPTLGADGSVEPQSKVGTGLEDVSSSEKGGSEELGATELPEETHEVGPRSSFAVWTAVAVVAAVGGAYWAGMLTASEETAPDRRSGADVGVGAVATGPGGTPDAESRLLEDTNRSDAGRDVRPSDTSRRKLKAPPASERTIVEHTTPESSSSGAGASPSGTGREGGARDEGRKRDSDEGVEDAPQGPPVLTDGTANRRFRSKNDAVRECFEKGLAADGTGGGSVQVEMFLRGDGEIRSVSIGESTVDSDVEECVSESVSELTFPPTATGDPARLRHEYGFEFEWQESGDSGIE